MTQAGAAWVRVQRGIPAVVRSADDLYAFMGARLQAGRVAAGVTQQQLADDVGLTRVSIVNIEQGRQRVPLHTLYALVAALEMQLEDVLPPLY
jgi:DNA-binding XRE family transcriptional regulator